MRETLWAMCALVTSGCSVAPAGPGLGMGADAGSTTSAASVELHVESPTSTTPYETVAVSGVGPGDGILRYEGADSQSHSIKLPSSGSFCEDVALVPGENEIRFEAISAEGVFSDPVTVRVTRSGEPPEQGEPEVETYYHQAAEHQSDFDYDLEIFGDGSLLALTDTDEDNHVHFGDWPFKTGWLALPLDMRGPLHHVTLYSTDDCPMRNFRLLVADSAAIPPQRGEGGFDSVWVEVARFDNEPENSPTMRTVETDNELAQWLGIEFFGYDKCTPGGHPGQHKLREIEAWLELERDRGSGGDPTPSCDSGY